MIRAHLNLPPKDAIDYFRRKGTHLSWDWQDTERETYARSFTVAKVTTLDVLEAIHRETDRATAEGITFDEFRKTLRPRLETAGWWGRKEVLDADTGELTQVQLGSYRRLRTIFQTNVQTAYMAGRYKRLLGNADAAPWWQYVAIMDGRTRHAHAELNGKVWRFDDPIWKVIWPPNGFNCRCRVTAISEDQLKNRGIAPQTIGVEDFVEDEVTINRAGDTMAVRGVKLRLDGKDIVFHPDPGWDGNPALAADENLRAWIERKASAAPLALKPLYLEQAGRSKGSIEDVAQALARTTRLGKAEGDARAWVIGKGRETGLEYLAAYNLKTGRNVFRTEGEAERVRIDMDALNKAAERGETVRLVHNHPASVSLSVADLAKLELPAVAEVEAVGVDRVSAYLARTAPRFSRFSTRLQTDLMDVTDTIFRKYHVPFEIQSHILNLALQQEGMTSYTFRLSSAHKRLYSDHGNVDAAIAEIAAFLKRSSS
ncbi:MAG: minor capsid protein [Azoarcus sp.]|jgi:SPP1 gp7 family putative phage head morphogenesis protein|nr:minor capsid protein [Azoarcus sp.]